MDATFTRLLRMHMGSALLGFALGAGALVACSAASTAPAAPVDRIVGISSFGEWLTVGVQTAQGALVICTYNSGSQGSTYRPRGCQTLPSQ